MAQQANPLDHLKPIRGPQDFAIAVDVSRETIDRLSTYEKLLRQWQKTINLVAPSTLDYIWHRHFADSAQLLRLAPQARTWVDLGSGAGFPGLVVAILLAERAAGGGDQLRTGETPPPDAPNELAPQISPRVSGRSKQAALTRGASSSPLEEEGTPRVTLIESNARKCAFLREVVRQTAIGPLVTVDILSTRIEVAATQASLYGPDVVSARALAPLDQLLNLAAPLFTSRTVGVLLKGRDAAAELETAGKMWSFNGELIPSRTEPEARIVVIHHLQARAKAKAKTKAKTKG